VSEALGISLLAVQAWYFWDSNEGYDRDLESERKCAHWVAEWARENQVELQIYREDHVLE
jgi:hypothetical protein